jgi:hypothetical protein
MILVDRGQKVRFLSFRDFGILFFIFLRMTSYLKMTIIGKTNEVRKKKATHNRRIIRSPICWDFSRDAED